MSWKAEYVVLIILTTLIGYFAALSIGKSKNKRNQKIVLGLSLFSILGILFVFKYFNFISDSVRRLLSLFSIQFSSIFLNVILPVGISFYTFQIASYIIDVYREKIKPEKHLGIFAVYVSFFPQLVAGPIERAGNLLPQFFEKHFFNYKGTVDGLKLMLWGFFKKIVIADNVAMVVDQVYGDVGSYTGVPLILATVLFAFQIYCDFSGYSDIAIGAAQVMGFRLMDNFKRPYFSRSISEFWTRWHISLSTWFRDYLYISLGGNKVTMQRWCFNIFVVFLISGLWHGANWTFVVWGILHGSYLIFSSLTKNIRSQIADIIGIIRFPRIHFMLQLGITFVFVNIGWVFFRANTLSDAVYVLTHLTSGLSLDISGIRLGGIGYDGLIIAFGSILFMEFVHLLQEHIKMRQFLSEKPLLIRWSVYLIIIFAILLFGVFESKEFIYFQF